LTKRRSATSSASKTPDARPDFETILKAAQKGVERVRTKSIDYSFNELFDMKLNDELLIDPSYQRAFRWSEEKQSQFIESLILELPIPPIYVIEMAEGRYELMDGLQRFSSYLHFRGELTKDGEKQKPLRLAGCDIVEELNGLEYSELPTALQIRLKRMTVPVQVLRKESDAVLRYHMFKRLNRGGEILSDQEVRNATIRLLGTRFNDFVQLLAKKPHFVKCTEIMTSLAKDRMGREENVLRFFAFKNGLSTYTKDIGPFLDKFMENVTRGSFEFDYDHERSVFETTFGVFASTVGEQSFSSVDRKSGALMNQFSQAHFDTLTLGIQKHLNRLVPLTEAKPELVKGKLLELKKDPELLKRIGGGGKNYAAAYKKNIAYVEAGIAKWLRTV
jgi:hypothetical protein